MIEWLSRQSAGELVPIITIVGGLLVGAFTIVAYAWASVHSATLAHRRAELDAALKQDMLNRGMSADEIERVLKASTSPEA
ncbi:MAG TPA: hypothetical protein VG713_11000 [Pirellulales bacterium]|nr:hypothetical protein [Pirellulales bacterium]